MTHRLGVSFRSIIGLYFFGNTREERVTLNRVRYHVKRLYTFDPYVLIFDKFENDLNFELLLVTLNVLYISIANL